MDEQREEPTQQQQEYGGITTFVNQSSITAAQAQPHDEDAWWWEVENGDLILDLVPNINSASNSESENTNNNNNNSNELSSDFISSLKSGEIVNVTLLANNTSTSDGSADNAIAESIVVATSLNKQLAEKTQSDIVKVENNDATYRLPDSHNPVALSQAAAREQTLEEFKEELRIKRLARQTAVQDLRDEIATLRRQLAEEQELTRRLRRNNAVELSSTDVEVLTADEEGAIGGATSAEPDSDDEDPQSRGRHANIELANAQLALQMANAENLSLRTEMGVVQKQVGTLKEVIACCKQMLNVKEEQCVQLKSKLDEIETAFGERELKIMSSNLRQEYERQLGNIRQLRQLYEERQRIALAEQENLQRLISIKRDELAAEQQKTKNFEEHNQTLMKEIESANIELATLREECNEHKFEKKALKEEMGTVNTDLILEKKSLVKETNRLKTLNCHLEYRLNEQEKRLSAVSLELTKTWHLVGKMQRQHRQLHTQEQILRYQLQQKRRLLTELKDELEYCRRKWAAARAKNDESQEQWNDLRREFALRKLEHASNSAESGYSDSGQASDEDMVVAAPTNLTSDVETTTSNSAGGGGGCAGGVGGVAAACRRKRLKEMFEHSRKIKRMQSTSPGRAGDGTAEIVLRWNSAPPTCGWRDSSEANHGVVDVYCDADNNTSGGDGEFIGAVDLTGVTATSRGAIPKNIVAHNRHHSRRDAMEGEAATDVVDVADGAQGERAERIQRLEEQCKTLIERVLKTSDNRERLEVQLLSFQDEIAPVQYVVPLNDFFKKKRIERMTRASSVPITGTLTPREEEYTRKRSERLGRLEEESRQLLSRIKRTSDRGHYLRCSLDRLRRGPSREGSFESNTEEESSKTEEKLLFPKLKILQEDKQIDDMLPQVPDTNEMEAPESRINLNPLTENEEAYTARRSVRLQRLENESKELLKILSRNNERGQQLGNKLDALHEHHSDVPTKVVEVATVNTSLPPATPKVSIEQRLGNIEQISSNRMERLRILEEEGKELLNQLAGTSARGTEMINRITARAQNRQTTAMETADNEIPATTTDKVADPEDESAAGLETTAVASVLPTLNNVACSSIVSEELTDHVTVTTIPSQIAGKQGAIPKQPRTKPASMVLNAEIRAKAANNKEQKQKQNNQADGESLEDMVRRLQKTPYPENQNVDKLEKKEYDVSDKEKMGTEKVNPNQRGTKD
ncbi:uncharacterized protein [Bactrocera oleae]|uniref:uncharacterized protein isoform X2 n=1 Tax=Bactrocera oleae TaxID=104688 RepID=UPI00387EBF9C